MGTLNDRCHPARALLLLDALPGVGPAAIRRLVRVFGSAEQALAAPASRFAAVVGRGSAGLRGDPALATAVDDAFARARAVGMTVMTWHDPGYPSGLRQLSDPPPVLFLRGRSELLAHPTIVTVVGARRATARGRDVAGRLGAVLGRSGAAVASGLALGIDGCSHAGALRVGGATLAVLGSGADVAYPRAHRKLFDRIAREGLLVSEFVPGANALPHHFPRRNRILAALARHVVVVEAGRRSGALITVDHALDLGRDVWAVPGPIDSSACIGSNRLLVDGAAPLVTIDGFANAVTRRLADGPGTGRVGQPRPGVSDLETLMLAALAEDVLAVDQIANRFGLAAQQTLAILTTLELHGEVERLPGMRFRRAA